MPQTYFTADWHFSHPNIAQYCPQFRLQSDNADELNEYLIDCWNRIVTPQDTVYNLGDVCFAKKPAHIEAVLQRLNGQHHLIYGNHDYLIRQNEAHFLNTRKADGHPLLSSASHYLRLKLPEIGNTAILCHYPLYEWDGIHHGLYHLYGHLHDRMAAVKGRALNVGWDMHGRFLTAQDIDGFLRDLPAVQYFDDKQNVIVGNSTEDAAAKVRARLAALNE